MKTRTAFFLLLSFISLYGFAQTTKTIRVSITNPSTTARVDYPVVLDVNQLNLGFVPKSAVLMSGDTEIPSQLDDLNGDR